MRQPLVLVVDDEPNMLAVMALALRAAGFPVLEATTAEEALLRLAVAEEPPGVLVTDIVMPGMSGSELAAIVAERFPDTAVLYVSGYGPGMVGARAVHGSTYLGKPFATQDLVAAVRALVTVG